MAIFLTHSIFNKDPANCTSAIFLKVADIFVQTFAQEAFFPKIKSYFLSNESNWLAV